MSDSRLEKFIYAICSMDVSDLPVPLSRIETLWNCLITGETPDFEPLSRNEKYLMAMLDRYDISNLPAPMSRGEKLLYKIAVGETDLSDVPGYLSRYEELLKYLIENGGIGFEYVLHTLNQSLSTLYATVEKPVKSAILKGNTLVNLNSSVKSKTSSSNVCDFTMAYLKPNTTYTVMLEISYDGTESIGALGFLTANKNDWIINKSYSGNGSYKELLTTTSSVDLGTTLRIRRNVADGEFTVSNVIVLEGDYTNVDIPYFEDMQSVKMPVLTTTGKNLFDENRRYESSDKLWFAIPFEKDSYFTFSSFDTIPYIEFYGTTTEFIDKLYGGDGVSWKALATFSNKESGTFKKESKYNYIIIAFDKAKLSNGEDFLKNLQVEQGTQATSYEPFKTNILTASSDLELRGIGEVQDELNVMTGEVVERVGEIVLDGSEDWNNHVYGYRLDSTPFNMKHVTTENIQVASNFITDKLPVVSIQDLISKTMDCIALSRNVYNEILVYSKTIGINNLNGFKEWLSQNPITVQYELATESIKTVDLTTVDQDGQPTKLKTFNDITYVEINADSIIPSVDLEVATKISETLSTMGPQQLDISNTQNKLSQTIDEQTENTDATMMATTEIYEQTL